MSETQKLAHISALRPVPGPRRIASALPNESDRLGQILGAVCTRNRYGEHLSASQWHAEPQACPVDAAALRLLALDAPDEAADPEQWLFLDTETTGLSGGTGTYAFLVGIAWWDAGGLQVEQFFMRDHGEEHSLLLALAERMAERRVLVTFNGKSFDWPLLETRFRMTRQIKVRAPRAHLDLLHPARQVWRLRLGSVRLTELERHVIANGLPLPWCRDDDVPGALIPQIYFDYLRGGAAEPVAAVFRHNQMDLRGLAALSARMLALAAHPESAESDALELYGLSRLLQRRGEHTRARALYERALAAGLPGAVSRAARRELAALAKRERDFPRATALWHELIGDRSFSRDVQHAGSFQASAPEELLASGAEATLSNDSLEAFEQLAIYYEHHAKEPERAAQLTRDALAALRHAFRLGTLDAARYRKLKARLDKRLHRLEEKTAKSQFRIGCSATRSLAIESNLD